MSSQRERKAVERAMREYSFKRDWESEYVDIQLAAAVNVAMELIQKERERAARIASDNEHMRGEFIADAILRGGEESE